MKGILIVHIVYFLLGAFASDDVDLLGKFIFSANQEAKGSTFSVLHKPNSVLFTPSPGPISSDEVASVLSLSLGSSVPKDISWAGLQFGDLFNRPKAVAIFSIDGLPKESKIQLSASDSFPLRLSDSTAQQDIVSIQRGFSLTGHVNNLYDDKSTSISLATDEAMAFAGGNTGKYSQTVFWNQQAGNWQVLEGESEDSKVYLKRSDILDSISSDYQVDKVENTVTLNTKGLHVVFHMDDKIDFSLFSELAVIKKLLADLSKRKSSVVNNVPDVFTFTISALKGLERKYGADSKQMKGALFILEKILPQLRDTLKDIYGGNIFVVAVTLPSELKALQEHHKEIHNILDSLKEKTNFVTDAFNDFIPELHVPSHIAKKARKEICNELEGSLAKFSGILKFKCKTDPEVHKLSRRSLSRSARAVHADTDYNLASEYDEDFAVIFNMWFWLIVILALALYAISVVMWNMDPGRDSIIFRLTQPKIKAE